MSLPEVVSRKEWLAKRVDFLAEEKAHTRARDALNAKRRELPMFLIDKDYSFETPDGNKVSLLDLFEGRRQLIVFHFMLPADSGGMLCLGCSFWIDNVPHHLEHMHARDTSLVVDWAEPLADILPHKERMGWEVPFVSSSGTDFYRDFSFPINSDETQTPGITAFLREGDKIYCTYATRDRGGDLVNNTYNYLDLTALGRQESELDFKWEWLRYHDEYDN